MYSRREALGGEGADQAIGIAQLGMPVSLTGAVGDDSVGEEVLAQARADGIGISFVTRRSGAVTGLIVEVPDRQHAWRYLEHLPAEGEWTPDDVMQAEESFLHSGSVRLGWIAKLGA